MPECDKYILAYRSQHYYTCHFAILKMFIKHYYLNEFIFSVVKGLACVIGNIIPPFFETFGKIKVVTFSVRRWTQS